MTFPSWNLLAQSILSGIFIGGLYGLIGLGLGLTWGLLRQINLLHFGLVFLGAYLSYQMATAWHVDPLVSLGDGVLLGSSWAAVGAFVKLPLYFALREVGPLDYSVDP